MTKTTDNQILSITGHHALPVWAKTSLALILAPIATVAVVVFLYAKFAGLEDEFGMIAEAWSYQISGGPVNKQSTEMGQMVSIMKDQLEAIKDIRASNEDMRDQLSSSVNRLQGRVTGLENRVLNVESWASVHSKDPKASF